MPDKFKAVWVSHSSIGDYLKCPRAYYLRNVYKDPKTRHKINIIKPALALGQAVHTVLESLSSLPVAERFDESLLDRYEAVWSAVAGRQGGFAGSAEEAEYKERGKKMLQTVMDHPGPLLNKAVKLPQELPYYWLAEDENIILCGKVDWLEYNPKDNSVHLIDFKTGKRTEEPDSLQLPIYALLLANCQSRHLSKASYWYLETDKVSEVELPALESSKERVLEIARQIKQAREKSEFTCPQDGCFACKPFEAVLSGQAEFVGVGAYNQDLYIVG